MNEPQPKFPFTPVPVRARRDGCTVERQYTFIEALAETGIVEEACRRVGMSRTAADNLRRRSDGVHFGRAWQAALDYSLYRIEEDAFTPLPPRRFAPDLLQGRAGRRMAPL